MSAFTDNELLTLVREGNHAAFTEIYNRHRRKLLAIAINHTKDKSAAEEIVQNIFINFWNRHLDLHIDALDRYLATAVNSGCLKSFTAKKSGMTA